MHILIFHWAGFTDFGSILHLSSSPVFILVILEIFSAHVQQIRTAIPVFLSAHIKIRTVSFNPLDFRGNYSAISNNMTLEHWPLMGGLLHLVPVQRGGAWAGCGPALSPPCCAKCNSPPINGQYTNHTLLYDGQLICGFNVAVKG